MKTFVAFALALAVLHPLAVFAASSPEKTADAEALIAIGRGHEQVAKELAGDHTAVVIQKGDKQFTIYGVVSVRAVGAVVEITVKNGEKYSVGAADIFFITNNGFKI
jgi:hypothetical protein